MSEGNRYNVNMEQTTSIYLGPQPLITGMHSLTHVASYMNDGPHLRIATQDIATVSDDVVWLACQAGYA
jgi:hypothetical protein